jgi:hypothetical protein
MVIDWDVPVAMDDKVTLRADVFRPGGAGRHPVTLSTSPACSRRTWPRCARGGRGGAVSLATFSGEMTGCGPFRHDDPRDRPPAVTGSTQTRWTGGTRPAYLLLPVIPH